nr:NAD(P)-binding domain-containing protein [Bradyrhizobium sp.]
IEANNVVVATGPYQRPLVPHLLSDHPVFQLHASGYRNPDQLPSGAVLVVGAGASGAQIADELHRAGRRVFLSVGQHTRMPRRYRGQDLTWWFGALRLFEMTAEQRGPIRVNPSITGAYGGYTIDFRRFAADGITLLGRALAARDGVLDIAPGLAESLAIGDAYYATFLDMLDAHVERHGLDLPNDPAARAVLADPPCLTEPIRQLDLGKSDIPTVIWATGYGVDFGWIDLPVRDNSGEPVHRKGIAEVPGLYFLGLPYLSKLYSAFLSGVGDDATVLADHIAARR